MTDSDPLERSARETAETIRQNFTPAMAAYVNQTGNEAASYLRTLPEISHIQRAAREAVKKHEAIRRSHIQAQRSSMASMLETIRSEEAKRARDLREEAMRASSLLLEQMRAQDQQRRAALRARGPEFLRLHTQARELLQQSNVPWTEDTRSILEAVQRASPEEVEAETQAVLSDPELRRAAEDVAAQIIQELPETERADGDQQDSTPPAQPESGLSRKTILGIVALNMVPALMATIVNRNPDLNDPVNTGAQWLGATLAITLIILEALKNDRS